MQLLPAAYVENINAFTISYVNIGCIWLLINFNYNLRQSSLDQT